MIDDEKVTQLNGEPPSGVKHFEIRRFLLSQQKRMNPAAYLWQPEPSIPIPFVPCNGRGMSI